MVNEVESHRPNDHAGGSAGRPVSAVSFAQDLLRRRPVDDEVFETFAFERKLDAGHFLGGDFERDRAGLVDEHAVAAVGEVEGDILVGLLAGRAAILVPDFDDLAVLHEGREALAQAVDALAHSERELLDDVVAPVRCLHIADAPPSARGKHAVHLPRT